MSLTQDKLRKYLTYNPETGIFTWNVSRATVAKGATLSSRGGTKHPYVRASIEEKSYLAHRLAWLYMTGKFPDGVIDHINGNSRDNRWCNLRCVSQQANSQNVYRARSNSKSGLLGAHFNKQSNRWAAQIRANGKVKHIGNFDDAQSAHQAYVAAKRQLHEGNRL